MDKRTDEDEVVEPEVLPPDEEGAEGKHSAAESVASVRWVRLGRALVAGLLLDVTDLYTALPTLFIPAAVIGALLGLYICRTQDVPRQQWVWWMAGCALYCATPRTHFFPLATLYLVYRALRLK